MRPRVRRPGALSAIALAAAVSIAALGSSSPAASAATSAASIGPSVRWGIIGDDGTHLAAERSAGVVAKLFELDWAAYEPSQGSFDPGYVSWAKGRIAAMRSAGFDVILSLGVQFAPSWLLSAYADSRYVDQYGDIYADACSGCEQPDLVWNDALRAELAMYIARAFADFGTDFAAVRIGGGHYGELGYPTASYNGHPNTYWAFGAKAQASSPVPGWKPGMASPNGEAGKFLEWYLAKLADYETWQIKAVRSSYPGPLMLLMPSWGIRPGQAQAAVNGNLGGTTSPEVNGEIQRGYDYARFVSIISDPNVIVDTTWLDAPYGSDTSASMADWRPVHYLAYLARQKGLSLYGENTGHGSASVMGFTNSQARAYGLLGFLWFDEQELFSGTYATLSDYASLIAANPTPAATPGPTGTPSPSPTPNPSPTASPVPTATPTSPPSATATPAPTPTTLPTT
ncbi:MAG TPA: beta-galactosidase, partial [Candidatus Dormibacteraeota bacterium]|nr:beta-galactosidase [Candidatus Dormibacteraeota bacterium]